MTLSARNFYNHSNEKKNYKVVYKSTELKLQRQSLTGHAKYQRKSLRRHTIGGINAGVSHGIKKAKPKTNLNVKKLNNTTKIIDNMQKNVNIASNTISTQEVSSPETECNKHFFKTKKSSMKNSATTAIINNNIKLKSLSNDNVKLSPKNKCQNTKEGHSRTKPADISFDTTDLMVDEPELEKTVEQSNIDNILQILENDWAHDDYDTMDMVMTKKFENIAPLKPVAILKDVTISPASELTDITSTINIKDISTPKTDENISTNSKDKKSDENESEHKYYPLFNKGHSTNKVFNEIDNKSIHNVKENRNWQLSVKLNGGENQCLLDAGQKNFGATQCMECGVVYQIGDPEDENAHLNYHNNKKTLKFSGWKTERVIMEDLLTSSRVILVEPDDPKQCWKKVADVLEYVDRDLGLVDAKVSNYEGKRVYLYIRDKAILGVLVAEYITTAYRMIPDLLELDCCTSESSPAKCGINVVWTDINHRRQGIATKLVDILRGHFYFGYILSLDDIAFSTPTPSGKIFAEKYTKTRNFKVYS
ncbi:establishment of cohesion isoform X2 [Megachile rotundata]